MNLSDYLPTLDSYLVAGMAPVAATISRGAVSAAVTVLVLEEMLTRISVGDHGEEAEARLECEARVSAIDTALSSTLRTGDVLTIGATAYVVMRFTKDAGMYYISGELTDDLSRYGNPASKT
jgi:hypothetical protein